MEKEKIKMTYPPYPPKVTPLAISLMVAKLRGLVGSETLVERVGRMHTALETAANDEAKNQS
jgi:hypothetical protein